MKKFVSTRRKGFHMTFENGITASVQWGNGNYCDNHFPENFDYSWDKDAQSNTAEVAVWNANNQWVTKEVCEQCPEYDDVAGYLSPEEVLAFLNNCANYGREA